MYIQYLIKTVGENRFLKIRSVKNRFVNFRLFANPNRGSKAQPALTNQLVQTS